eukprot:CAMPEP_0184658894 /NCGR_PEP_ID=MMETSP0308-20130426/27236_1 /TAXON_ID=38269 /ORGANISM="Gloeochaete witrockiana, Strain SAG 46.84" /LENGTH=260 /DNA_ID=CAMNT_0027098235 /DNA_START=194 /DNA_END=976 /DNA_ORIENTATION=+
MRAAAYKYIYEKLTSQEKIPPLLDEFPDVSYNTLLSIYSQKYQLLTRQNVHRHRREDTAAKYLQWYLEGQEIIGIAERVNFSPCLLARIIVERLLKLSKPEVSRCLKDPSVISDERLRREVEICVECDETYSPSVERVRHINGTEYEYILQEKVRNLGIPFATEDDLRRMGYPKTPDIKLEVPIGVNGHVVNWIDSKASFGDEYTHDMILKDQLQGYVNRFGPGMVIYWFDFMDSLEQDANIYLVNDFPAHDIVLLPRSS